MLYFYFVGLAAIGLALALELATMSATLIGILVVLLSPNALVYISISNIVAWYLAMNFVSHLLTLLKVAAPVGWVSCEYLKLMEIVNLDNVCKPVY